MNNRREFLDKCGYGLAGIIAAGNAPAAIVKSMLGTGGIKLVGAIEMPTAVDYIQDGLVALWDGIENEDWGIHNPNATVWKDLSGNDFDAVSRLSNWAGYSWGDDCWISDAAVSNNSRGFNVPVNVALALADKYNDNCCEFVLRRTKIDNSQQSFWGMAGEIQKFEFASYGRLRLYYEGSTLRDQYTPFNGIASLPDGRRHTLSIQSDAIHLSVIVDGQITNTFAPLNEANIPKPGSPCIGNSGRRDMPFRGEICCIRIYNRALENNEIARNRKIDKARFGI